MDSDLFDDYLLPIKRRKFDISSDLIEKCSEKLETELYPAALNNEILKPEEKNTNSGIHSEITEYDENYLQRKVHANECVEQPAPSTSPSLKGFSRPPPTSTITDVLTQNGIFFEDCVNDLMSKNGFLLPINPNHQQEDYYDDEDDDEDEEEYDDDVEDDDDDDDDFVNERNEIFDHILPQSAEESLKAKARNIRWVRKQILAGVHPLEIRSLRLPHINDLLLWSIITRALSDPPRRIPLRHINQIEHVVSLLQTSKNIIILTGAGVSVSCGIPDFRSRDGIYSRLAIDYPDLPDPQSMFSISYFNQDPRPFFKFAREIYPGQFKPSPCHHFIKLLEKKEKLLRNYTQNIDTLEQISGIKNVIECHGSFATATCTKCRHKVAANEIHTEIFQQKIPLCRLCNPDCESPSSADLNIDDSYKSLVWRGIMKPDIVFFGEDLPEKFHSAIDADRKKCDLLIVIGSSLKVRPVALIPSSIPSRVPQILINRESLTHLDFDVELLGNSDTIINQLCHMLGDEWNEICWGPKLMECEKPRKLITIASTATTPSPAQSPSSNTDSSYGDYRSVMQMSIDSGFDSSSNPSIISSSNSAISTSSQLSDTEYQTGITSDDSLLSNERIVVPSTSMVPVPLKPETSVNEIKLVERHLSTDSTKDSGISGASTSSFADGKLPKVKQSVAELLPSNTYCRNRNHRYIFPGAEVYSDESDNDVEDDDDDVDDDDDDNDEDEHQVNGNNFVVGCTTNLHDGIITEIQQKLAEELSSTESVVVDVSECLQKTTSTDQESNTQIE